MENLRGWRGFKICSYMNYTLKFQKFSKKIHRCLWLKRIDINSWIPLLFRALDGVGDHRALYHVPNNIIATLVVMVLWFYCLGTLSLPFWAGVRIPHSTVRSLWAWVWILLSPICPLTPLNGLIVVRSKGKWQFASFNFFDFFQKYY